MRNTYTLLDFGNWIENSDDQGDPYIQLLSVTNPATAHSDFVTSRLGGVDTTGDSKWYLLPADQMQHSPVSEEEKKKKYQEMILSRWPYIFTGCLVFVLIIIGLIVWRCCCRRKGKFDKKGKADKGMFSGKAKSTSYLPLQTPHQQYKQQETSYGDYGNGAHGYGH